MQRNILTLKFLKVQSKTHLSIEHRVFNLPFTVEVRHLNRQRPRVPAGVLMLVPFRTLASVSWCSLSTPRSNGLQECRLCLWPREQVRGCVRTDRKQSWVAQMASCECMAAGLFCRLSLLLVCTARRCQWTTHWLLLKGVGGVGRVPVTTATKCYAFSTQCLLFFK